MFPFKRNDALDARAYRFLLVLIVLSAISIDSISIRKDHDWGGDFSQYIAQAKALNDGTMQDMLQKSHFRYVQSSSVFIGPELYPWGFPLLLVPIYHIYGINPVAMKLYVTLFLWGSFLIMLWLFRDNLQFSRRIILIALFAYCPFLFGLKNSIVSDLPFLFFSLAALLGIQRFIVQRSRFADSYLSYVLIGFLIFAAYYIRRNGILLLPVLLGAQVYNVYQQRLWQRARGMALWKMMIPYIAFGCLELLSGFVLPKGDKYSDQFALITLSSISHNVLYYSILLREFFAIPVPKVGLIIYVLTIPIVMAGAWQKWRSDYIYIIYIMATVGLCVIFPGQQGVRYFIPILPLYLYFLLIGLDWVGEQLELRGIKCACCLGVGWLVVMAFFAATLWNLHSQVTTREKAVSGPYHPDSLALFEFIKVHTPEQSVIAFYKPRVMTLYTDRRSARITDVAKVRRVADFLVCMKDNQIDMGVAVNLDAAENVFENGTFKVFRIVHSNRSESQAEAEQHLRWMLSYDGLEKAVRIFQERARIYQNEMCEV